MPLPSGTHLGPYEILAPIGAGGMGQVYKARDTRLGRTVAVKVLPDAFASESEFRERFEREARSISALSHPNICTLHDVGSSQGIDFLVLEHLEGETLASRLGRGALPLDEVLTIASAMASALETAHRRGIVHRDLKPANVMLTKAGPKLLDFGLAKTRPPAVSSTETTIETSPIDSPAQPLTARGTLLGTFQYMAPEQIDGGDVDRRTDIFAFGAVLYEMVTGRRAFEGKSQASLLGAILKEDPPPMSRLVPLTPPALDFLVRTCLAKDPDARIQTAHDVLLQLRWVSEGSGAATSPTAPSARSSRGLRTVVLAATILAAIAVGFFAASYLRDESRGSRVWRSSMALTPEHARTPAISPDGRHLAYVAVNPGNRQMLYVRSLDALTSRPLPGSEGATYPFWSTNSQSIGFFTADGKLRRVDVGGGPTLTICNCAGEGGSWGADDVIVFSPQVFSPILRVSAAGGDPAPATTLDRANGETAHNSAMFLPDGKRFLYHAEGAGAVPGVYVASVDGGRAIKILDGANVGSTAGFANGQLIYSRDETLVAQPFDPDKLVFTGPQVPIVENIRILKNFWAGRVPVFTISQEGTLLYQSGARVSNLRWLDRTGKPVRSLGTTREYVGDLELSPDGRQLAVSIADVRRTHIWLIDVATGAPTQLTFGDSEELGLRWSPDGSRVVYRSIRQQPTGGVYGLYMKDANGGGTEDLVLQKDRGIYPDGWSSDGRSIEYEFDDPRTTWDFWTLVLAGRREVPFLQLPGRQEYRRRSSDGRWIAYISTESGTYDLYVMSASNPGAKWKIAENTHFHRWRRDGRELFFLSGYLLKAAAIETTPSGLRVTDIKTLFTQPRYMGGNYPYDVSHDGQHFLFQVPDESVSEQLTLMVNWPAILER